MQAYQRRVISYSAGFGVLILALAGVGEYFSSLPHDRLPQVQETKTDLHQLKYFSIENNIAVTEVDGEPILEFIKKHPDKK